VSCVCRGGGGGRHLEFTRDALLDEPGEEHLVDVHSCSVRVVEDQRKAKAVGAVVERLICMQRSAALRECECECECRREAVVQWAHSGTFQAKIDFG
jgi:hypothetical protein